MIRISNDSSQIWPLQIPICSIGLDKVVLSGGVLGQVLECGDAYTVKTGLYGVKLADPTCKDLVQGD